MSEGELTKVCPLCAEKIKVAAKLCPFCQSKLSRYARWREEIALLLLALFLCGLVILMFSWLFPDTPNATELGFRLHRRELKIVRIEWNHTKSRPDYSLTGFVTNRSSRPWRVHELEIRFLREDGKVLDTLHHGVDSPFVVQPGHEHAFRVAVGEVANTNLLSSAEIRVQIASDGNRRFDRD